MATTAPELREEIEYRRQAIDRDLNELGDKVSPSKVAQRTADRTVAGSKRRLAKMKEAVMGTTDTIRDKKDDLGSSMEGTIEGATDDVRRRTAGNPLGAGLAAFGLGLVVAAVWPSTDAERRTAAALEDVASDQVRDVARHESQEIAADLREPAREAASAVEDRAVEGAENIRR